MVERDRNRSGLLAGVDSGQRLGAKDIIRETTAEERPRVDATVAPERIQPRKRDTRKVNPAHVADMAESIAAVGLLEPLVVDLRYRLLAGAHRLAAILQLREQEPDAYAEWFPTGVPVRVMAIDAEEQERDALEIEITENEKRREYSPKEVRDLAQRLRELGYRDAAGRPAEGETSMMGRLTSILGKSESTVRRLLRDKPPVRKPAKPERPARHEGAAAIAEQGPAEEATAVWPVGDTGRETQSSDRVSFGPQPAASNSDPNQAKETLSDDMVSPGWDQGSETLLDDRVSPAVARARSLICELREVLTALRLPAAIEDLDRCLQQLDLVSGEPT